MTTVAGSGVAGNANGFGPLAAWGSAWGIALVPGDGDEAAEAKAQAEIEVDLEAEPPHESGAPEQP